MRLSEREQAILRQLACGRTDNEIARDLGMVEAMLKTHLIRLFMADQPITDLPGGKGHSRVFELHRGIHHPRPSSPPA